MPAAVRTLRRIAALFALAVLVIGRPLFVIDMEESPQPVLGLLFVGFGSIGSLVGPSLKYPFSCASDAELAASYRRRFFLYMAFSAAPALLGFCAFFITYSRWPYVIGVVVALASFLRTTPTEASLARDQAALNASGCSRSLVDALNGVHS